MKKLKVYQTEGNYYKEMKLFGKFKYLGESFGAVSLTNNKIYDCVDYDKEGWLQIVDDSGEDYCYSITNPRPLDGSSKGGRWEPIEIYDDSLQQLFNKLNTK